MAKITIVDDDYAIEIIAENLRHRGHQVTRYSSLDDALAGAEEIATSDLIILDLIIPYSGSATSPDGAKSSGMTLYREVRRRSPSLPILVFSANEDPSPIGVLHDDQFAEYVSKWSSPSQKDFIHQIVAFVGEYEIIDLPQVFIVHGTDETTRLAVKNFLQNTLGLPEPIILHEQANKGNTIIEKFERLSSEASLIFVLMTADDQTAGDKAESASFRSRQNVIFELGYFVASLGRSSGRIILLHMDAVEIPSDLHGVVYIDISAGIESAGEAIRKEIKSLGYKLGGR